MPDSAARPDLSIRVRAVIDDGEGRLLLDRTHHPDKAPFYWLPGGGLEPGETSAECLERELYEEACLEVDVGRLLYVSENVYVEGGDHRHEIILYRLARVVRTAAEEPGDRRELAWHRIDELDGPLLPTDVADALRTDLPDGFVAPVRHLVRGTAAPAAPPAEVAGS